jgi:hypothetical protein
LCAGGVYAISNTCEFPVGHFSCLGIQLPRLFYVPTAGQALARHVLPTGGITDEVNELAAALVTSLDLSAKARTDAAHIALAAVHGMHFLLTWNCTHIANAEMAVAIQRACREHGFPSPVICTPEELMRV